MNTYLLQMSDMKKAPRSAPEKIDVLPYGRITLTKGGKVLEFDFDKDSCRKIVQKAKERGKDIVVDYDHATLNKQLTAEGNAPAGAWGTLEEGNNGLVLTVKNWTEKARKRLENGEYRYISPVVRFRNNIPCEIDSIALTNHPAIHNINELVAANDYEEEMENSELVKDIEPAFENVERKAVIEDVKENIKETMDMIKDLQGKLSEMIGVIKGMTVTPEEEDEIQAFTDDIMTDDAINSIALPDSEIVDVPIEKPKMSVEQKNRKLIDDFVNIVSLLEDGTVPIKEADSLKKKMVLLKQKTDTVPSSEKNEVYYQALKDYKTILFNFRNMYKADKKEEAEETPMNDSEEKVGELKKEVALLEVEKYMRAENCKISEAEKEEAFELALNDIEGFRRKYKNAPLMFEKTSNLNTNPLENHKKTSKLEDTIAEKFGNNPEEVYKN